LIVPGRRKDILIALGETIDDKSGNDSTEEKTCQASREGLLNPRRLRPRSRSTHVAFWCVYFIDVKPRISDVMKASSHVLLQAAS
jgi:hypothetical protein